MGLCTITIIYLDLLSIQVEFLIFTSTIKIFEFQPKSITLNSFPVLGRYLWLSFTWVTSFGRHVILRTVDKTELLSFKKRFVFRPSLDVFVEIFSCSDILNLECFIT